MLGRLAKSAVSQEDQVPPDHQPFAVILRTPRDPDRVSAFLNIRAK